MPLLREWIVTAEPVEHDDVRGVMVSITDGQDAMEVGRVAYVREQSVNPQVAFGDKLDELLAKADRAAEEANASLGALDELRFEIERERERREREAQDELKRKVREVLGAEPRARKMA